MRAPLFTVVRGKIGPKIESVIQCESPLSPLHYRQVKNFIAEYVALQELCAAAQSRNNKELLVDTLDRMKRLARRVRFMDDGR